MDDKEFLIQPDETVQRYLARAKEARAHLRKSWEYHVDNGRALYEFKLQLKREIPPPNDPDKKLEDQQKYRDSMGEFLRLYHYHEDDDEAPWTKPERNAMLEIMERLDEVEEWRSEYGRKYGTKKLEQLNNPAHVLKKFKTANGEVKPKEKKTKQDETSISPASRLRNSRSRPGNGSLRISASPTISIRPMRV